MAKLLGFIEEAISTVNYDEEEMALGKEISIRKGNHDDRGT